MLTVEQFCGAVESVIQGQAVELNGKRMYVMGYGEGDWRSPYAQLKGTGLRVPRVIKDACDGKLTDPAARAARRKLELYFWGEGPKAEKFQAECQAQNPLTTA